MKDELVTRKLMYCKLNRVARSLAKLFNTELPYDLRQRLLVFYKSVSREVSIFEAFKRHLNDKYGEKGENGNVTIHPSKRNEMQEEYDDFLESNAATLVYYPLELKELKNMPMSVEDHVNLEMFLDPEELKKSYKDVEKLDV